MNEKRIESRLLCSSFVNLTRRYRRRDRAEQLVNLENISPSGACISSDKSIPLHAPVLLEYAEWQLPGIVRYSMYFNGSYVAGIEFSFGCKWAAECFHPVHLTDLRQLDAKRSE